MNKPIRRLENVAWKMSKGKGSMAYAALFQGRVAVAHLETVKQLLIEIAPLPADAFEIPPQQTRLDARERLR